MNAAPIGTYCSRLSLDTMHPLQCVVRGRHETAGVWAHLRLHAEALPRTSVKFCESSDSSAFAMYDA